MLLTHSFGRIATSREVGFSLNECSSDIDPEGSYIWPTYDERAINHNDLLITLLINVKARQHLPTWSIFSDDPIRFSALFRRLLSMTFESSATPKVRVSLLCTIINAFQSLDNGLVRKECAPLVSISIWHNIQSDEARERSFGGNMQLKKVWRASARRYEAADEDCKAKLRFERSWLYTLILGFVNDLYDPQKGM